MTAREGDWSSPEAGVYGETYGTDTSQLVRGIIRNFMFVPNAQSYIKTTISESGVTGRSSPVQVPISDRSDWSEVRSIA